MGRRAGPTPSRPDPSRRGPCAPARPAGSRPPGSPSPSRRRPAPTWLAPLLVLLVGTLAAAGCTSGVAPRTWARSVCQALAPWRTSIASLTDQAQQQMSSATTPEQAKTNLVALLSGAQGASETARRRVADAGTPKVDHGEEIAARFVASLAAARDAYGHARDTVSALDTGRASDFYAAVSAAFHRLNDEYAASAFDPKSVGSAELHKAFVEVPECR
jgi:hypothetical protein